MKTRMLMAVIAIAVIFGCGGNKQQKDECQNICNEVGFKYKSTISFNSHTDCICIVDLPIKEDTK